MRRGVGDQINERLFRSYYLYDSIGLPNAPGDSKRRRRLYPNKLNGLAVIKDFK